MRTFEGNCRACGVWFRKPRRPDTTTPFCSRLCQVQWWKTHPVTHGYTCFHCNQAFICNVTLNRKARRKEGRKFCSRLCWQSFKATKKQEYAPTTEAIRKTTQHRYHKEWYTKNRQRKQEQNRLWRTTHLDQARTIEAKYQRQYRQKYPDRLQAQRAWRRAPGLFTGQLWSEIKKFYGYCCLSCKRKEPEIKLEPDHVKPIVKGGTSTLENMQPLCRSCNAKKHSREIDFRNGLVYHGAPI